MAYIHQNLAETGSNRLAALAADIQAAHRDAIQGALAAAERALAAGRMLEEAKATLSHGKWASWLAESVGMSARTARRYMQIARAGLETATVADLGIKGAAKAVAKSSRSFPKSSFSPASGADFEAWFGEMKTVWAGVPEASRAAALRDMVSLVEADRCAAWLKDILGDDDSRQFGRWVAKLNPDELRAALLASGKEAK